MSDSYSLRRRTVLSAVALSPLALTDARAQELPRTPLQHLGPFYPVLKPEDADANLAQRAGASTRANGRLLVLTCRILDTKGSPVSGAAVEVWQANAGGRYRHPHDTNPAPLDPNFDGYARVISDEQGRFTLTTVKPGPYPSERGDMRTPHIHFDITSRSSRLLTQMYFPDEPLNATDRLLLGAGAAASRLMCKFQERASDESPILASWEIVIAQTHS